MDSSLSTQYHLVPRLHSSSLHQQGFHSLDDVDYMHSLWSVPLSANIAVPVPSSGSDLHWYVVSGVDLDKLLPKSLVAALTCSSHKILQARYMGFGSSALLPFRICRLLWLESPFMAASLSFTCTVSWWCIATDAFILAICEPIAHTSGRFYKPQDAPTHCCGVCWQNDRDITSKDCPVIVSSCSGFCGRQATELVISQTNDGNIVIYDESVKR